MPLAVFSRARVPSADRLVLPRWTVEETGILIGLPDVPAVLTG
ncbi:hypothetical protein [Blastococcus sp. SYSU DS0533]